MFQTRSNHYRTKLENNYHVIEELPIGVDIEVLVNLIKLFNKYSMHFYFQDFYYQHIKGLTIEAPLSGILANFHVDTLKIEHLIFLFLSVCFWDFLWRI